MRWSVLMRKGVKIAAMPLHAMTQMAKIIIMTAFIGGRRRG
jgi:hypothetical protein